MTGFFDYLERVIENEVPLKTADLAKSAEEFLAFNKYQILDGISKISHAQAEKKVHQEYDKFRVIQDQEFISDFDRTVKKALKRGEK